MRKPTYRGAARTAGKAPSHMAGKAPSRKAARPTAAPAPTRKPLAAAARKTVCVAAALALVCAAAMPAFGAETIINRDGGTADTVLTGKVGNLEDVISVKLPSNIKMTIKTDKKGCLDDEGTPDVSVTVENESRSTKAVKLALYETTDDQNLLDEVVLKLNGQDIKQAKGRATSVIPLTELIQPGATDTLTMSASPISPTQVISSGTRNVRTVIKAVS